MVNNKEIQTQLDLSLSKVSSETETPDLRDLYHGRLVRTEEGGDWFYDPGDNVPVNQCSVTDEEPLVYVESGTNQGGANITYVIVDRKTSRYLGNVIFQDGPPMDGFTGVLDITLLEIVRHRMSCFLDVAYQRKDAEGRRVTALIRTSIDEAMNWMVRRTVDRRMRGVFKTYKP